MVKPVYYNENEPIAAEWLRRLIAAHHLPSGDVDDRSITAVRADDLDGYRACHFFAGIGGWPLALELAGWPDDREIWTGSCPCQPFSTAGRRRGPSDSRHLWPVWRELIGERRPRVLAGEQVEAAIGHEWLCTVRAELEHLGYAVAPVSVCAASVGAPHIRQRLYFVADADATGRGQLGRGGLFDGERAPQWNDAHGRGAPGHLADADGARCEGRDGARRGTDAQRAAPERGGAVGGFWSACEWIACRDGTRRPVEPGTFPLAHGIPARVGRMRAYGNALVPQLAAEVIGAYLEARPC